MSLHAGSPDLSPWPWADAWRFVGLLGGWSLALFAMLRAPWVAEHVWLPFTRLQGTIAAWYAGEAWLPVAVTLECSGSDVAALCAGSILAYPVRWSSRLLGMAGGYTSSICALHSTRMPR